MILCEAPSPDDSLRCDQEIGHLGWHRCNGTEWFGDCWAVSEWADTQEWPVIDIQDDLIVEEAPTMSAQAWAEQERNRIPVQWDGFGFPTPTEEFGGAAVVFTQLFPADADGTKPSPLRIGGRIPTPGAATESESAVLEGVPVGVPRRALTPAEHFEKLMGLRTIAQVEELLREERRDHLAKTARRRELASQ
jgi:hypothetical protein